MDACRYFAGLLVGAVQGVPKETLLSPFYHPAGQWHAADLHPEIAEIAGGSFARKQPPAIRGKGYVVTALEAALWAFANSTSFAEGCLLAANLGDDADTTAAIYGQLAGAYYGESGIPAAWREKPPCANASANWRMGWWRELRSEATRRQAMLWLDHQGWNGNENGWYAAKT